MADLQPRLAQRRLGRDLHPAAQARGAADGCRRQVRRLGHPERVRRRQLVGYGLDYNELYRNLARHRDCSRRTSIPEVAGVRRLGRCAFPEQRVRRRLRARLQRAVPQPARHRDSRAARLFVRRFSRSVRAVWSDLRGLRA